MSAYGVGFLLGMLTVGLVLGLFTLHTGKKHGQEALGWGGFFACLAGAFAFGLLGAGPMALLFAWLIRKQAAKTPPPGVPAWPEAGPERVRQ
jgi:hypothetical protein